MSSSAPNPGRPRGAAAELRFVPEVRSADVERTRPRPDRLVLYTARYPDLDVRSLGPQERRVSAWTAWTWAFRGRRRVVELPEPLWLRALPFTCSVGLAFRLADLLHRRRTLIVTYAMENNAPERLFRPLSPRAGRVLAAGLRRLSGLIYDRIAFASPAARACYRDAGVLPRSVATRDFVELMPRCDCVSSPRADVRAVASVVFLGALEARKGLPDLLAAWALVPARRHGWVLRIAGSGRRADDVRQAAATDASIDVVGLAGRDAVHAILRDAEVLVLPSRREGRWCEQIGLPVVEGLAHGCRVVATPDTGLAPWLREHGHVVLPADFSVRQLADALTATLDAAGTTPGPTTDALPDHDARVLAEDWMRAVPHTTPDTPDTVDAVGSPDSRSVRTSPGARRPLELRKERT